MRLSISLLTASALALAVGAPAARADDFVAQAKATVKAATEKSRQVGWPDQRAGRSREERGLSWPAICATAAIPASPTVPPRRPRPWAGPPA